MPLRNFLRDIRQRIDPQAPALGSYARLPSRRGRPVTQEELAEAIGVSRVWYQMLESSAKIRTSTALLDRLSRTLMMTPEERAELFQLAMPELNLGRSAVPAAPANGSNTGTILDGLPPLLASATADCSAEIDSAAYSLARARQRYHCAGSADGTPPPRSRILASWNRCRVLGVDPGKKAAPYCDDVAERRRVSKPFLEAAAPIVAYLADQLADTGYVVVVADTDGVALELAGDLNMRRRLAQVEIEAGGDWSEASAGTNAIGTALADRRPMQAWASEHFCEGPTVLTCSAAPICVPGTLKIAGVLSVSASYRLVRPHLLGVIMQAALEIEEQLAASPALTRSAYSLAI
jgi:transcriptional regulator with XRE-family HTH domain